MIPEHACTLADFAEIKSHLKQQNKNSTFSYFGAIFSYLTKQKKNRIFLKLINTACFIKVQFLGLKKIGNKFNVPPPKKNLNLPPHFYPQKFYWIFFIIFMFDSENLGKIL